MIATSRHPLTPTRSGSISNSPETSSRRLAVPGGLIGRCVGDAGIEGGQRPARIVDGPDRRRDRDDREDGLLQNVAGVRRRATDATQRARLRRFQAERRRTSAGTTTQRGCGLREGFALGDRTADLHVTSEAGDMPRAPTGRRARAIDVRGL
jgi:hypothetical protein